MLDAATFASKLLLYAAALGGAGVALHRAIGIVSMRRLFLWLGIALATATLIRLIIINAQMGGSLSAAFALNQFSWTWIGVGRQTMALLAGASLLFVFAFLQIRSIAVAAAVAIAAGFGLAGHSTGLAEPGVAPFAVMLHALIAAFWFVAPFTLWPRTGDADAATLHRTRMFSRFAVFLTPLLFLSGVWLLWRIGGGIDGVIGSLYGRLLLGKLLLATAILGLGALNMTVVTQRLASAPASGRKALRATLRIDAMLFLGVLLLIASATTFAGPNE